MVFLSVQASCNCPTSTTACHHQYGIADQTYTIRSSSDGNRTDIYSNHGYIDLHPAPPPVRKAKDRSWARSAGFGRPWAARICRDAYTPRQIICVSVSRPRPSPGRFFGGARPSWARKAAMGRRGHV